MSTRTSEQFQRATVAEVMKRPPGGDVLGPREFEALAGDHYVLRIPDAAITFEIDRLRRERHELIGELAVRCELPGARSVGGVISAANMNLSSLPARQARAKFLAQRSQASLDWVGLIEEFAQVVLTAERTGDPGVDLRTLPERAPDSTLQICGLSLPQDHPTILFGDGGSAKSYLALYVAGKLSEQGRSVALFDWELAGEDHRERLGGLFPDGMPRVIYARAERPLVYEVDRLKRIVQEHEITHAVFDSIAFPCDGPPEAAEVAGRYFRAVRSLGIGSLHAAHISKAEGGDKKPFGSTFWHNGARSTWFVKLTESSASGNVLTLGLFNRKNNLGRKQRPLGYQVTFDEFSTEFRRAEVADRPDMAEHMTVRERIQHVLRHGSMTPAQIAEEISWNADTVRKTLKRHDKIFTLLDGGRFGVREVGR